MAKEINELAIEDNAEEKSPVNMKLEIAELRDEISIMKDQIQELYSYHKVEGPVSYLDRPPERK